MPLSQVILCALSIVVAALCIFIMAKTGFKKFRSLWGMAVMFALMALFYFQPNDIEFSHEFGQPLVIALFLTIAAHLLAMHRRGV